LTCTYETIIEFSSPSRLDF
jgi:SAM-dependent methyltransferase